MQRSIAQECETVVTKHRRRRDQETARRGARVDKPRPYVAWPSRRHALAVARGLPA